VVRHPVGGVRTHILYTYPLLAREGYRFTFVIPAIKEFDAFRQDVGSWEQVEVVEAPVTVPHLVKCRFFSTIRSLLKQRRYAMIHSHGLYAAAQVALANLGFDLPHVVTSHDVFCHVPISPFLGRLKLLALAQILRRVDALVAVSNDVRDDHLRYLPALGKAPCRLVTIHNGIDIQRFTSAGEEPRANLRQRLGIGDDVCLLGFLGRFMEQKGFLRLVDALSELITRPPARPFHLVAVGSGDFLVNYQAMLEGQPNVLRHISFLPHTPNPAALLKELDLLVMPSLWEAHPLLPMEAMIAGIPVLGTTCVGLREVLRGTPSVMTPANDPIALANGLCRAIDNPWLDEARAYVPAARERFDVKRSAEELSCLFDEVLNGRAKNLGLPGARPVQSRHT
jgi:glycosyltransferase involved in cell wall biosynthesis